MEAKLGQIKITKQNNKSIGTGKWHVHNHPIVISSSTWRPQWSIDDITFAIVGHCRGRDYLLLFSTANWQYDHKISEKGTREGTVDYLCIHLRRRRNGRRDTGRIGVSHQFPICTDIGPFQRRKMSPVTNPPNRIHNRRNPIRSFRNPPTVPNQSIN